MSNASLTGGAMPGGEITWPCINHFYSRTLCLCVCVCRRVWVRVAYQRDNPLSWSLAGNHKYNVYECKWGQKILSMCQGCESSSHSRHVSAPQPSTSLLPSHEVDILFTSVPVSFEFWWFAAENCQHQWGTWWYAVFSPYLYCKSSPGADVCVYLHVMLIPRRQHLSRAKATASEVEACLSSWREHF